MTSFSKLRSFGESKFGSIRAFAEAMEMKPPSIQKYLSGESMPGFFIMQRLAKHGCDINWLVDEEDERSFEQLEKDKTIKKIADTYYQDAWTVRLKLYEGKVDDDDLVYFSILKNYNRIFIADEKSSIGMQPLINPGDYAITDVRADTDKGDLVLCKFLDNITGEYRYIIKYFKETINDSVAVFHGLDFSNYIYIDINSIKMAHKIVIIRYKYTPKT
jgi:transcriptional regulator with XRE-family HTH domain